MASDDVTSLEQQVNPELGTRAEKDVVSRATLDTLTGFTSEIKALSQRVGRVRKVRPPYLSPSATIGYVPASAAESAETADPFVKCCCRS